MSLGKTLVIGSSGQLGLELVAALRQERGTDNVIASDIRMPEATSELLSGPWETLDVLDLAKLSQIVQDHNVDTVYLLAAMLSAVAEKHIAKAWELNMEGLFNVLNLARDGHIKKIFWPSSIAVFGPTTPKVQTPQDALCEPTTVYGISKLAGERWCEYYHNNFGVDVRSLRYPGLIGYKSAPGGGTTDYAVDIFHQALDSGTYDCFLAENTRLPMMYMDDAIRATLELMRAPAENLMIRSSYNLSGVDFTPAELAAAIKENIPGFTISYAPDFREKIAQSWPDSIDDSAARRDWNWQEKYDLGKMTETMLSALRKKKAEQVTFN